MGAGASAFEAVDDEARDWEESNHPSSRYYCHTCHRMMNLIGVDSTEGLECPVCSSTFLEQINPPGPGSASGVSGRPTIQGSNSTSELSETSIGSVCSGK